MAALPFARYDLYLDGLGARQYVDDDALYVLTIRDIARLTGLDLHSTSIARVGEGAQHGISAQGLIVQSHITLHGWRDCGGIMCDVVSCREYDPEVVRRLLVERFQIGRVLRTMDWQRLAEVQRAAMAHQRGYR